MLRQPDRLLYAVHFGHEILFIPWLTPTCDEEDAEECQETATHKFASLLGRGALKVAIEDRAAEDDAKGEHNELDWNDLRGIKPLESLIDVADLHDCSPEKNKYENVGYGSSKGPP